MGKRKGGSHSETFLTTAQNQADPAAAAAAAAVAAADAPRKEKAWRKEKKARQEARERESSEVLDAHTSRNILEQARLLAQEEEEERQRVAPGRGKKKSGAVTSPGAAGSAGPGRRQRLAAAAASAGSSMATTGDDDWAADLRDYEADAAHLEAEIAVSPAEQALIDQFSRTTVDASSGGASAGGSGGGGGGVNLGALIMQKIQEAKERSAAGLAGDDVDQTLESRMDPEIVRVYRGVGEFLQRYRAGKLPKAFRLMVLQPDWEEALYLTQPDKWSRHAVYAGTKVFVSSLPPARAELFLRMIVLPRVCEELEEEKKLSFHLYRALRKATYKPAAFFKGLVFPLLTGEGDGPSGECSLRAAAIICSVITRASLPVLHGAAAMVRVSQMPYSAASCFVLRCLLDKRYALPFQAIDAVYAHFVSFMNEERRLPKLWHQCMLVFAQRYREQLEREQKLALRQLLRRHVHRAITPEIRRELFYSPCRHGEQPIGDEAAAGAGGAPSAAATPLQQPVYQKDADEDVDM